MTNDNVFFLEKKIEKIKKKEILSAFTAVVWKKNFFILFILSINFSFFFFQFFFYLCKFSVLLKKRINLFLIISFSLLIPLFFSLLFRMIVMQLEQPSLMMENVKLVCTIDVYVSFLFLTIIL